jgi:hypothetical protein
MKLLLMGHSGPGLWAQTLLAHGCPEAGPRGRVDPGTTWAPCRPPPADPVPPGALSGRAETAGRLLATCFAGFGPKAPALGVRSGSVLPAVFSASSPDALAPATLAAVLCAKRPSASPSVKALPKNQAG